MMRSLKAVATTAVMIASMAVPAFGAVLINAANSGYNFTVDYTGLVNGSSTNLVGGLSTFTFTGVSNGGLTYNFGYSVTNDSSVASRLTAFGFDVDPNVSSASSTGTFAGANLYNNFPQVGTIDVCFEADSNGNCTGGSGGVNQNQTGTGTFALTFAQVMQSVSLSEFTTRFQSINPSVNGSTSGVGIGAVVQGGPGQTITAPEPGTWLMMMGGFGMVGFALRRRRTHAALPQIA
ncbi:MAG: PEP-CTERM sorting domain-containing protein [Sphingomonadales bacterium]|nr:MAG: PEP-CTERM sorting domain-containing protein [Sphingomonadales bacterium]